MIKKRFLLLSIVALFTTMNVNAQSHLLSDVKYDVSVGFGIRSSNAPFDVSKFGFHIGVDAIKPIKSFANDKVDTYGLLGLHFVQKGGKQSSDFMDMMERDNSFTVNQLSIPIHAGAKYSFKRCSVFLDAGPYIAFGIGGSDMEGLERKVLDFGIGLNAGIKFKRFGISFGFDKGFTNIAQYTMPNDHVKEELKAGEICNLKSTTSYIAFRWTLGKKSK